MRPSGAMPSMRPSHTAIATPRNSTSSEKNSVPVGVFFSMNTEPKAATMGMLALLIGRVGADWGLCYEGVLQCPRGGEAWGGGAWGGGLHCPHGWHREG